MTDLTDLIARIEAAEGPSRELDREIAIASGWLDVMCIRINGDSIGYPTEGGPQASVPAYTADLNAAMSLVPEGWNWMAGERNQGRPRAYVNNGELHFTGIGAGRPNPKHKWYEVVAATPALALCAAALKAKR